MCVCVGKNKGWWAGSRLWGMRAGGGGGGNGQAWDCTPNKGKGTGAWGQTGRGLANRHNATTIRGGSGVVVRVWMVAVVGVRVGRWWAGGEQVRHLTMSVISHHQWLVNTHTTVITDIVVIITCHYFHFSLGLVITYIIIERNFHYFLCLSLIFIFITILLFRCYYYYFHLLHRLLLLYYYCFHYCLFINITHIIFY